MWYAFLSGGSQTYAIPQVASWRNRALEYRKLHAKTRVLRFGRVGTSFALCLHVHGRRRHPRFSVTRSSGLLSVLKEVAVRQAATGELIVIDREPQRIGDVLTLETLVDGKPISTRVRVVASRPDVRDGNVFHELRLMPLTPDVVNKETR